VFPYEQIFEDLTKLVAEKKKICIDEGKLNYKLYKIVQDAEPVQKESVIEHTKALKSATEMEGMRQCNIRDCAAIMKYFGWVENELKSTDSTLDEYSGARKMDYFRTEGELYKGPSFDTISSIGPNGAVIHYKPEQESALKMVNG
jgi:Xaa-Pro aminopeptidase